MKSPVDIANKAAQYLKNSVFVYDVEKKKKSLVVSVAHNIKMNLVDITLAPRFGKSYTINSNEFDCRIKPVVRMYAGI